MKTQRQLPKYKQNSQSELALASKPLVFANPQTLAAAGPIEIGFTLDTSDSMGRLLNSAVAGFNVLVSEQRAIGPEASLSFNLFSSGVHTIYSGVEINSVPEINLALLAAHSGATALLDGIGCVIKTVGARADRRSGSRVLIAILTDGMENHSRLYSFTDIFASIHYRRSVHKWEFLFMCADDAGERYGLSLGIQKTNICRFSTNPEEMKLLLSRLSAAVGAYRLGNRSFAGYLTDKTK